MNATNRAVRFRSVLSLLVLSIVACRSEVERTVSHSEPAPLRSDAPQSGELVFSAQPGWERKTPASPMRKAEFALPRVGGDVEDATLVVYYFGVGQGGGREANLERWSSQFEQPDGVPSKERIETSSRKVAGLDVYEVQLAGTYVAETAPGSGTRVRKEGWRMLASIVESDTGPYYAKLVGPAATVGHWEASYRRFISEVRPGG